jgi:hypothetical protein
LTLDNLRRKFAKEMKNNDKLIEKIIEYTDLSKDEIEDI